MAALDRKSRLMILKYSFYVWFIPITWALVSVLLHFHSGDEHGCFYIGTLPFSFICTIRHFGSLTRDLQVILPIGIIVMAGIGYCLDCMKINKRVFVLLLVAVACSIFYFAGVVDLGSLDKVARKYSVPGFAGLSYNVALWLVIAISPLIALLTWLWRLYKGSDHTIDPND